MGDPTDVRRALPAAAAVVAVAVAGAGCGDDEDAPSPSFGTATASGPDTTERDAAVKAAKDAVVKYHEVISEINRDPAVPMAKLKTVSAGSDLEAILPLYRKQRDQGVVETGKPARVVTQELRDVDLENSGPRAGGNPYVVIEACRDVSKVTSVDAEGNSAVQPDRPDSFVSRYTVGQTQQGWRVFKARFLEEGTCHNA